MHIVSAKMNLNQINAVIQLVIKYANRVKRCDGSFRNQDVYQMDLYLGDSEASDLATDLKSIEINPLIVECDEGWVQKSFKH